MSESGICTFIIALSFIAVLGFIIYSAGKFYASKLLGLTLSTEPDGVLRGETMKILMRINPKNTVDVSQIRLRLECRRTSTQEHKGGFHSHHSGDILGEFLINTIINMITGKTDGNAFGHSEKDIMARSEMYLQGDLFQAGQEKILQADMIVPTEGLPTDVHGNLTVRWFLTATFEVPSSFSAEKSVEIKVIDSSMKRRVIPQKEILPEKVEQEEFKMCPSCGKNNNIKTKFCIECGTNLD